MRNNVLRRSLTGAVIIIGSLLAGCITELDDTSSVESEVLGPPANVVVSPTTVDRATVSWDPVAGATKYYVFQSTGGGPAIYINTARAPSTSLQVAHLLPNTAYCFEVQTEDGTGPGASSPPTCATTPSAPPPPDTVLASPTSPTAVNVSWSSVTGATKYYVYQSQAAAGPFNYINTTTAPTTNLSVSGLTAMTTYCFKVQVDSANGPSALSAAACNNTISPPTNITATRVSSSRIRINWTGVTGATKYYVYETAGSTPRRFRATVLATAPPTYTATSLSAGTQYCYQLRTQGSPTSNVSGYSLPTVCATP